MSDAINYLPTTATSHNNNFSLFTTKLSSSDDGSIFHKIVQEDKDTGGEEYERQDRMTSNCSFLGTTFSLFALKHQFHKRTTSYSKYLNSAYEQLFLVFDNSTEDSNHYFDYTNTFVFSSKLVILF